MIPQPAVNQEDVGLAIVTRVKRENGRIYYAMRDNFARIAARDRPCSLITLWREAWPRTNSTRLRGQSIVSAKSRSRASFAAASTGGAVTLMRNSFPSGSPISLDEARGCNLTDSSKPSGKTLRKAGGDAWLFIMGGVIAKMAADLDRLRRQTSCIISAEFQQGIWRNAICL
jgi:hypothetical protein